MGNKFTLQSEKIWILCISWRFPLISVTDVFSVNKHKHCLAWLKGKLTYAAISHNQIYWISDNPPIRRFMQEIFDDFIDIIDEDYIEDFVKRYNLATSE